MPPHAHRRRIGLYLVAVVLPSMVLVALALRGVRQERELDRVRRAERRAAVVALVGRELEGRLVGLAAAALDSAHALPDAAPLPEGVIAVGRIRDGRLLLPWDIATSQTAGPPDPRLTDLLLQAERRELVSRDPRGAARLYREALAAIRDPAVAGPVRLKLARAHQDAGDFHASWREAQGVLDGPAEVADQAGVPLVLFAGLRLLADPGRHDAVAARLVQLAGDWQRWPPSALYLARRVADSLLASSADLGPRLASVTGRLNSRLELANRMLELQAGFIPSRPGAGAITFASWVVGGEEPLAVGPIPATDLDASEVPVAIIPIRPLVAALAAEELLGPGPPLRLAAPTAASPASPDVLPVSPRLIGLVAEPGPDQEQPAGLLLFYLAGLGLVVLLAGAGAWLLWRDVRREVRLAELRSQFVSGVSHELRTPLTSIRLFAETLNRDGVVDEAERREYLETIITESERLSRLLNNVLDFGQIERGEKRYLRRPESLPALVRETVRATEPTLAAQGYRLEVQIEPDLPMVPVDRDAIEQVILNLLSNAMKYSGGSREIQLRLYREGGTALLDVVDHGIGIPLDEQERIFERYYRAATAGETGVPGSGLGLTLVRHVAQAHGGAVTVRSAPAQGSTFTLQLPLEGTP